MEEIIGKVVLGKVIDELMVKPIFDEVKKVTGFGDILKSVKSILKLIGPTVHEIKLRRGERNPPMEESESLIQLFEKGEKLIQEHSRAHWLVNDWIYAGKITAFYESLLLFFQFYIPLENVKIQKENLVLLQSQLKSETGQFGGNGVSGEIRQSGDCYAPEPPPAFMMVGLKIPLRKLKNLVFGDDASVIVVTAPGGCGKTTLVQNLCQDLDVKGIDLFLATLGKNGSILLVLSIKESNCNQTRINWISGE